MAEPASRPWCLDRSLVWPGHRQDRRELVGDDLLQVWAARDLHGHVVIHCLTILHGRSRWAGYRVFSEGGPIEPLPGQIRRPDVDVECGPLKSDADKAVERLGHIVHVDPDAPNLAHWSRQES